MHNCYCSFPQQYFFVETCPKTLVFYFFCQLHVRLPLSVQKMLYNKELINRRRYVEYGSGLRRLDPDPTKIDPDFGRDEIPEDSENQRYCDR
jgi:hypothetical protein